jgi:hypothetical protein
MPTSDPALLTVPEDSYRFGEGPLRLRLTTLVPALDSADGRWRGVAGVEVSWDGRDLGERTASVRADVLAAFLTRRAAV